MPQHNRRSFFKKLAAAAVATWADVVVGPVMVIYVVKHQQPGPSDRPVLIYKDLEAAYEACQKGRNEPDLFYCTTETVDRLKAFPTASADSSFL